MSYRRIHALAAIAVLLCFATAPASAQTNSPTSPVGRVASTNAAGADPAPEPSSGVVHRMALVIGNSTYQSITALRNPANDSKVVTELLSGAGFEVVSAVDLSRAEMRAVVDDFAAKVGQKGPDTVALVFYAGHGVQVDGENFLVPVDADIRAASDVADQTVRLADIMKVLESVPSRMRIVILDACRNNPFSALGDAGGRGLAIVDAPNGSIVAYSTAPGTEALDGQGAHSPYAAAFMKMVKQPGLPIEQFFKRVRRLVHEATDGRQTPWESSSFTGDFAFFPELAPDVANAQASATISEPRPVKVAQLDDIRTRSVNEAYDLVIEEDSIEYYEEFVRLYPSDPLCERIRRLLARRQLMVAWYETVRVNSPIAYGAYLRRFGRSDFAPAARRLQTRPRVVPVALLTNFANRKRPDVVPTFRLGGARPILPRDRVKTVTPRFNRAGLPGRLNDRSRANGPRPGLNDRITTLPPKNNRITTLPPKRDFSDRVKTVTPGRSFRDRVKTLPPRGTVQDRVAKPSRNPNARPDLRNRADAPRSRDFRESNIRQRNFRESNGRQSDFRESNVRQRDFRQDRFQGNRNPGLERNRIPQRVQPQNRFDGNRNSNFNRRGNAQSFPRQAARPQGAAPRQSVQRFGFQNRPF